MPGKKGKQKKATEPNEASKLIAARISQLELDAAGEKDQEAEIGAFRRHSRGVVKLDVVRNPAGSGSNGSPVGEGWVHRPLSNLKPVSVFVLGD